MDSTPQSLQFLDIDDNETEEKLVIDRILSKKSNNLELPWTEQEEPSAWNQQQQFGVGNRQTYASSTPWVHIMYYTDGETEVYDGGGSNEVYPIPVAPTTIQQIYHQPVIPPMANLAFVNPHPPFGMPPTPITYHPTMFTGPRASKQSPKKTRENYGGNPPYPPQYSMPVSYQYMPSHPASSPVYMTGPPMMYAAPPPHYNYPVYQAPMQQPPIQEEIKLPEIEKEIVYKNEYPREEKIKSVPINAIKKNLPPAKKREEVKEVPKEIPKEVEQKPPQPKPEKPQQLPPPPQKPQHHPSHRSWAQIAKKNNDEQPVKNTFKPPMNAVAVSAPPMLEIKNQQNFDPTPPRDEVDPHLRKLGEVLTKYTLDHKNVILTPRGLKNPSNYCYINAILQALLACPAFYNLIKVIADVKEASQKYPKLDRQGNPMKSKTPIIDSMIQFIKEFPPAPVARFKRDRVQARKEKEENSYDLPNSGPPFEPTYIYKMLRALRSEDSFHEEGRQEDAEEFLSLLLNKLNDEMLDLQKLVQDPKPVLNGDLTANGDAHGEEDSWKEVTTKGNRVTRRAELERTPLSDIFRGQLRSSVHRPELSSSSDNVQPFFTLQLDIEASETVSEALEKLVGRCLVEGASPSHDGQMFQQQSLDQLPCVLILHLKCFHYREQTPSKIVKSLLFPIDLKLDQKLLSSKNQSAVKARQYKLFAVVYHDGKEATKGHYLTDVFYLGGGAPSWIRYDDPSVTYITESQVLQPKPPRVPYLLYYRRADTIGPQNQNLVSKS